MMNSDGDGDGDGVVGTGMVNGDCYEDDDGDGNAVDPCLGFGDGEVKAIIPGD